MWSLWDDRQLPSRKIYSWGFKIFRFEWLLNHDNIYAYVIHIYLLSIHVSDVFFNGSAVSHHHLARYQFHLNIIVYIYFTQALIQVYVIHIYLLPVHKSLPNSSTKSHHHPSGVQFHLNIIVYLLHISFSTCLPLTYQLHFSSQALA